MADDFKMLYQGRPGATATTLYTVPALHQAIVKHIRVTNPTGTDRTLTLWHGGTGDTNVILPAVTVLAGGWGEFDGAILMNAADVLSGASSSTTTLTVTVYGDEVSV